MEPRDTAPGDEPGHPDDPQAWRHETARINGIDLHYVTVDPNPDAVDHPVGAAGAPTICLLHGFPEYWYAWRHQLTPLAAAGYRVVAPDLRGYNRSSQPTGVDNYRMTELVGDVRGLIAHLGAPRATVVGHDWGGVIAWETAIREPDIVRELAVLNAPHPERYRHRLVRSPGQLARSWYVFLFQVPWLPEGLLRATDYRLLDRALQDTVRPAAFTDEDVRRYREAIRRSGATGPINYYRAIARDTGARAVRSVLPWEDDPETRVEVPTLLVWGERDPALGSELLDGLDTWVDELRIERLPGASHWVQADAPDRVTDSLLRFIR